jgi:hypothetical protein
VDFHIIAERDDPVHQRIHQLRARPARQIRPPDGTREETIADEDFPFRIVEEHDMAGRVSGAMQDFEAEFANVVDLLIGPVFVKGRRLFVIESEQGPLRARNANPAGLFREHPVERLILSVQDDFRLGPQTLERRDAPDVVQVRVRQRYRL